MVNLRFNVYRAWADRFEDAAERQRLHELRAQLLHGLVESLSLQVIDWGKTDGEYPHESVTVVFSVEDIKVFENIITFLQQWYKQGKIIMATVGRMEDSKETRIERANKDELQKLSRSLGF